MLSLDEQACEPESVATSSRVAGGTHQVLRSPTSGIEPAPDVPQLQTRRCEQASRRENEQQSRTPGCPVGRYCPTTSPSASKPQAGPARSIIWSPKMALQPTRASSYPVLCPSVHELLTRRRPIAHAKITASASSAVPSSSTTPPGVKRARPAPLLVLTLWHSAIMMARS
jgi:hypothetical protein